MVHSLKVKQVQLLQTVGMWNKCGWRRLRLLSLHRTARRVCGGGGGQGSFCMRLSYSSGRRTAERGGRLISSRRNRLSSASLKEGVKEPVTLCPLENLNTPENMPVNSDNAAPQERFNRAGTTPLAVALMPGGFFSLPFSLSLSPVGSFSAAATLQRLRTQAGSNHPQRSLWPLVQWF